MTTSPDHAGPPPSSAGILPVRLAATEIFDGIVFDAITLDRAFSDHAGFAALNPLDRALTRMIVTTAVRRLGQIDDIIRVCMNDKLPEPRLLQTLLRLSVAQIVFMNIPDHAAVNIAVNLAEALNMQRQKGLVNAVLRRVAREGKAQTTRQDIPRLNIPSWMLDDWLKHFGKRAGLEIAQASLNEAHLDLSVKDPKQAAVIAATLNGTVLPCGTVRVRGASGAVDHLPGFHDGTWWVQDAAAHLPVLLMGKIKNKVVIDLCAAPGGKTAQAAAAGADVIALDRVAARLDLLRSNLERLHLTDHVEMIEGDGTSWQPDRAADFVLIDAPCTASGTLRRNPDIPLHRSNDDVLRMSGIQTRLLNNATKMLKSGGAIIYAVCSLQAAEGEDQVASFIKRTPGFTISPIIPDEIGGWDMMINKQGCLRALPTHLGDMGGIDGFFAARIVKS